ncbi:hypothetical protein [Luteolibacter marinus]|uniref:hypothetical protein n=1 Tax=Luteolibacter marinus TaxID=2776705 RepID=UPI001866CB7E|nr:hypothetical protein [Luteolibacter marinus]
MSSKIHFPTLFALVLSPALGAPLELSGIYPSLAMFNEQNECGTGAVVPWADRLWVITYAPHEPNGSDDKLYEITPSLDQIIHPESIGGTPANRMIHDESRQLFIGPYVIGADRRVRATPYRTMFGRHTGNARHLTDPAGKIVFATMEEGIYEMDVKTLAVKELWGDEQSKNSPRKANLPGYHGKGFYSGQGVYVYANNGEHGTAAQKRPDVPSGVLAEWDGKSDAWTIVRRNQFTEVTGPGGIHGNPHPETDPIWASGWDFKSLLFGVRMPDQGWTFYRLPKGSHSYDGAHGWNTEWPRIRDIGEDQFLMTMHGTFWKFPKTFTPRSSTGIEPRSNYLKVIGDFARWNDRLVMGCDDTARNEFLNKRKAKGKITAPQSQSNLWFVDPGQLDHFGPAIGRGAVWVGENVAAGTPSDPFLFSGYDLRSLHLRVDPGTPATVRMEVDVEGHGQWSTLREVAIPASGYAFVEFAPEEKGAWIRLASTTGLTNASAVFTYHDRDPRDETASGIFEGLAGSGGELTGGLVHARDGNKRSLAFAAVDQDGKDIGCYELDADLKLTRSDDPGLHTFSEDRATLPTGVLAEDAASIIYTDDHGKRWRLPKGSPAMSRHPLGTSRVVREVATERDLFNAHGTFYELPAENAGGFAKVRPVATHNRFVHDFCSYRGLFIVSGIATNAPLDNAHIIRSSDGKTALWAGAIDDIWQLGKPVGRGGPWQDSPVKAGIPSDPYLMTAYDRKELTLASREAVNITAEIDLTGDGRWAPYKSFGLKPGVTVTHEFPDAFHAYWIRFVADQDTTASAQLRYR